MLSFYQINAIIGFIWLEVSMFHAMLMIHALLCYRANKLERVATFLNQGDRSWGRVFERSVPFDLLIYIFKFV